MTQKEKRSHCFTFGIAVTFFLSLCIFNSMGFAYASRKMPLGEVTFVAGEAWAPFIFEEQGEFKGLYVDILKQVFEIELGGHLSCQLFPWKRVQKNVKNGDADFMVTVATEERLEYAIKSRTPILELYLNVYTYTGHPKIEAMNDISSCEDILRLGLRPVTNLGNIWHKKNIDSCGVKTFYGHSEINSFKMLAAKRSDITIEPLYSGNYLINKLRLADKITPTRGRFGPIVFYLMLSKKSVYAQQMNRINQAIDKVIASSRYQEILDQSIVVQ